MPSRAVKSTGLSYVPVSRLDLDPLNPRIVVAEDATQLDLLIYMYEEESIDELVTSFVENGYFEEEPLVVVPHGQRYWTVEGNRRLATIKLLMDPVLRRKVRVAGWPKLTVEQRDRLRVLPCVVHASRDEVLPFLGYRHITGAKKWAPFQKARFVARLLEGGQSLQHIQELIGDTTQTTRKLYQDFVVYNQIIQESPGAERRIRDRFSLLEVALGQRAIKSFLGMPRRLPTGVVAELVPEAGLDRLQEVTRWVFGDVDQKAVIEDSREIPRKLARVIENDGALGQLRLTNDLDTAFEYTGGEQQFLLKRLAAAERALRDAAGLVPLHSRDKEVRSAVDRLEALIGGLQRQLTKRR